MKVSWLTDFFKGFSPLELFITTTLSIYVFLFEIIGNDFAKMGIPIALPESFGGINNFSVKLFPMEIFIGICLLLLIYHWRKRQKIFLSSIILKLIMILCLWTFVRAGFGIELNAVAVVRNSAMIWYLVFSLILASLPISISSLERIFWLVLPLLFLIEALVGTYCFAYATPDNFKWYPDLGILFVIIYGLYSNFFCSWIFALVPGLLLGGSAFTYLQRTSFVGAIFGVLALPLLSRFFKFSLPRRSKFIIFGISIPLGFLLMLVIFQLNSYLHEPTSNNSLGNQQLSEDSRKSFWTPLPLSDGVERKRNFSDSGSVGNFIHDAFIKSETTDEIGVPVEVFRYDQWKEAGKKFLSAPFWGVGFHENVVSRVFLFRGKYLKNDGNFERAGTPPLSGPHNSYLHLLARVGILGILILVIHLLCLKTLLESKLYVSAVVMYSQMVYAFFNIGLEGPIHSLPILITIAIAIKAVSQGQNKITTYNS